MLWKIDGWAQDLKRCVGTMVVIGAGRVGGVAETGVVYGCRGTGSGRARVGRHKLAGQGVLVVVAAALSGSRRGTCHMVGIPSYKCLLPAGTN